jgi:hypothetical protein
MGSDFVVVPQEPHIEAVGAVEEDEPEIEIAAAFEDVPPQLPYAHAAVDVRAAEGLAQITQRLEALRPLALRQTA